MNSEDFRARAASKQAQLAQSLKSAQDYRPDDSSIAISSGLAKWLLDNRVSLAFTSYQTGQLILAGVGPDGRVAFNEQNYARATGLWVQDGDIHVASMFQIWRLSNMLQAGQFALNAYDALFVPRSAQTTNYVDAHELAVDKSGRMIFVNSRYSCLATFDERFSFRPVWKPPFISALRPEDRCHLNGLALRDGTPAYVTAFSTTDEPEGWRPERQTSGVIIEVESGEVVTAGLSMPHSPRVHDGALWALDSGRGQIVRVNTATGEREDVAFCAGFLRGLVFINGYAVVTVSRSREGRAEELAVGTELRRRGMQETCGVLIVDLARGDVVEWIHFEGKITELFDVALLRDVRNPMSIGPATVEMIDNASVSPDWAPLR